MSVAKRLIEEQLEENGREAEEREKNFEETWLKEENDPRITGRYKLKTHNRRRYNGK